MGVPQKHHDDRRHGQGEQHAEDPEKLSAGRDRKDHGHRMQADAIAHQKRREHHPLESLRHAEYREHAKEMRHIMKLHNHRHASQQHPDHRAEIRHKRHQRRRHSDRERKVEPHQPQAGHKHHRLTQHHQKLPAQKLRQHLVALARKPRHRALMLTRQQVMHIRHQPVPVAQQVEGHHRHHQQVGQPAKQDLPARGDPPQHAAHKTAEFVPVAEQRLAQGLSIDPDLQIGRQHRKLRHHYPLQPVEHQRQVVDQRGDLFFEQRQ